MLPKFDRKDARFYVGNPNISLISGKLSFVTGDSKPDGLRFLALLSIPEYMELREVLEKFQYDIPKIKTIRVLKTEFSKHYGLALEFIQPDDAKEFHDIYHNKHFNAIEENPIVLRWISGVCLDLLVPKECSIPDHSSKVQNVDTPERPYTKDDDGPEEPKAERKPSRRVDPETGDFDQPTMDVVSVERPSEYIFSISENYQDSEEPHMMEAGGHQEHDVISARDCPICLEPLLSNSCIMVLCSHKFHVHCLQAVQDHTCPVCRYQQYPFQVTFCDQCSQHEGLWCCVICGFVGCGGALPVQGHSKDHAQETSHIYAKPLLNEVNSRVRGIWDHSKEGFIHNLVYRSQEGGHVVIMEQESSQARSKGSMQQASQIDGDSGEMYKGKSGGKKFSEVQDQINQLISEQLSSAKELFEAELKRIEEEHLMVEAEHRDLKKIFEKEILEMMNDKKQLEAQLTGLHSDNQLLEQKLIQMEATQTDIIAENNLLRKQKKVVESQIEERREAKRTQLAGIKQQVSAKIEEIKDIKVHLESQKKFEGKVQPGSSMLILGTSSAGSKNSSGSQKKR